MATILFVNDQTYAMNARADWLRGHGYIVLVAGSRSSALEALLTNPVSAAVLDCHMQAACEIAQMLKNIRPELPLVMLASYCAVPCPLEGAGDVCIAKQDPPATLLDALQTLLLRDQEAA